MAVHFNRANGPLAVFDTAPAAPVFGKRAAPSADGRSTIDDMYHDVGMYRSKGSDEVLDDTVRILSTRAIGGGSSKGAQVSANAGPTNWFSAQVTIRIKKKPHETGVLMPDDNCPRGANWYGTFSRRVQIPLDPSEVEVLVNGDSAEEIAQRQQVLQEKLGAEGLGHVPVVPIDRFLSTRFKEIAGHLPEQSRAEFISGMERSPLWTRKAVGEIAATMGDAEFAKWREEMVPAIYSEAHDEIARWFERDPRPERGPAVAARFLDDANRLSEGEQLALAHRIKQPYKFAVASAIDGYETYGNGIHNALPPRTSASA
jgi:hypothetical protein